MTAARILAGAGLVALLAGPAAAQGLGDKAANEKAKREKKGAQPAKVFTNEDLDKGRPPGQRPESSAAATVDASASASPDAAAAPVEDRNAQEKDYLDAITAAQQAVTAAQTRVQQLSEKLNPMSLSYIYGASGSNDANEELRVRAELREAEAELQAARQNVATANDNLRGIRQGRSPQPLVER